MIKIIIGAAIFLAAQNSFADTCESKIEEDKTGKYIGCTATVNDHVAKSDEKQITRFGCEIFCTSLTQNELHPSKIRVEFEDEIAGALSKDQCSAEQIKDNDGFYKGCNTNVNGHVNTSDQKELTSLGCDTFCAGLARFQRQILKMEMEKSRTPPVPEEKRAIK